MIEELKQIQEGEEAYYQWVRVEAAKLRADGCTGVPEFHRDCCLEHDIAYRTGFDPRAAFKSGEWLAPITRAEADARFRKCNQERSLMGRFSPMSWWRWAAVRLMARKAFKGTE